MKIKPNCQMANVVYFIEKYGDHAVDIERRYCLPALAVLGQAALETGWGQHILIVEENGVKVCSNNIFNIKAGSSWVGRKGFVKGAWEVISGKDVALDSFFRIYDNIGMAFENYAEYILARRYPDGQFRYNKAFDCRTDAKAYITAVHNAGYATDPKYSAKVISIFETYFVLEK